MPLILLTHIVGEEPRTERGPTTELLRMKEHVLDTAERLRNAHKHFHLILGDDADSNVVYLEVFDEEGCLRRPGPPNLGRH